MPASILTTCGSPCLVRLLSAVAAVALLTSSGVAAAPARPPGPGGIFQNDATPLRPTTTEVTKTTSRPSDQPSAKSDSYEHLKVDETLKEKHSAIIRMFRDGFGPGDEEIFNNFYDNYAFPRWTVPANATTIPNFRRDLSNETRTGTEAGAAVRARLAEKALTTLDRFAKGNYSPAVRYNAMLAIGELYGPAPAGSRSLQPLAAAMPKLLEAVKSADQIDAVKVAALVGILRHAALGISDAQEREQQVVPAMLTIATTKVSPGRSPQGHAWIRSLAIDVLGEIGSLGPQNSVVTTLADIAANAETPFMTRCAAARAVGKLRYDPNGRVDPQQLAARVARLAADALAFEVDQKPPDFQSMLQSRNSGSMPLARRSAPIAPRGMEPPEPGAAPPPLSPEESRVQSEYLLTVRRRLLTRLDAAKDGLFGPRDPDRIGVVGLAVTPPQKTYVDAITKQLDAVISVCESDRNSYDEFQDKIKEEATLLREAIDKIPTAKAEGEAPAAAEGEPAASQ